MPNYLTLSFPGCACLFWLIVLAGRWRKNSLSQKIFALNMLVTATSFYIWNLYFEGVDNYHLYYRLDAMETFFTLLIHPFVYFFFKSLTNERALTRTDYLWLLPALLIGGGTALLYGIMGEENAGLFVRDMASNRGKTLAYADTLFSLQYLISVRAYNIVLCLQIVFASVYAVWTLFRYQRKLNEFYSSLEDKSMNTVYAILVCYSISLFFSLFMFFTGSKNFLVQYPDYGRFIVILWGGVLNYLGFLVVSLRYTAEDLAVDLEKADTEARQNGYALPDPVSVCGKDSSAPCGTLVKRYTDARLDERLEELMDTKKVYLQSELRLDELARMMQTNRTYISRLINDKYHCSFSDLVNRKRIEYAKELMQADPQMKQEQISQEAGFLHPATFSRTFKQVEGITFREWQKKNTNQARG